MKVRSFWIFIVGILLAAAMFWTLLYNRERQRSAEFDQAKRLESHCMFIGMQLDMAIDDAFKLDPMNRELTQYWFETYRRADWREVNLCAPEGFGVHVGCLKGDLPCMTAAFTNAYVVTHLRW